MSQILLLCGESANRPKWQFSIEFLFLSFHQHVENNTPEDKTCRQVAKRKSVEETWSKKGVLGRQREKVCGVYEARRNLRCMYVRANIIGMWHLKIPTAVKRSTRHLSNDNGGVFVPSLN